MEDIQTPIQKAIQTLITIFIYGLLVWLIWILITSIADSYNQHLLGIGLAVIAIILMLPAKWIWEKMQEYD